MRPAAVILAAGQSTRMKSKLPKVLHPIAGQPMVQYVVNTVRQLDIGKPVVVIGHGGELVRRTLGPQVNYVEQREQLGTGHAVLQAREILEGQADTILVLYGDMPLLSADTVRRLLSLHEEQKPAITILTCQMDDPMGFGRVVRDESGRIVAIVEEAVATEEERRIKELNCGICCFDSRWLWSHLSQLPLSPKGEYYLTDLVGMAVGEGARVEALLTTQSVEVLGINNRVHLARVEAAVRRHINKRLMSQGVTIFDPPSTFVDVTVEIGADTVLYPNTFLQGKTTIGEDCHIGPNTIVRDSMVGHRCRILVSVVEEAVLEDDVDVGPFAHLRKGAHLAQGVHMGNFGEVKNSYLGPGTKMGHFSYVGDATVGQRVNIGAGTVTCNFDGQRKHPTIIEDGAFIGSDTMLVAPVRVGSKAKTGAGAVVTRDVPAGRVAYGVPARIKGAEGAKETSDSSETPIPSA